MTVVTVPLDESMMKMLKNILSWTSSNKADVFRNALRDYYDEQLLKRLDAASKEAKHSPVYRGNLRKIAEKFND